MVGTLYALNQLTMENVGGYSYYTFDTFQSSLLLSKYCQRDPSERVSVSSTAFRGRSARSDLDFSQGRHLYRQVPTFDVS